MHIRRLTYTCLLAVASVTLQVSSGQSAARGFAIEEDGNEIVTVWDGVATGEIELLEGGTSGTLELFWLDNDSLRFQPSGVGDSLHIDISDSSQVAITKLTTWTFTAESIDEHGHIDLTFTQFIAGASDYVSPDVEVHIEHDHAEAEGLRLVQNGDTIVYVNGATAIGEVSVPPGETTDPIQIWFVTAEDSLFQLDPEDGFSLDDSLADPSVATIAHTGDWEFTATGDMLGMTDLIIKIHHEDHTDYTSPPIELHVESEHAEAEGLRLVQNGDTIVYVNGATATGEVSVPPGETTDPIQIWFVSAEDELFQPDTSEGFSLVDSLADPSLATITQTGEWEFTASGDMLGMTDLFIKIHHIDHIDYTSPAIELHVESEHAEAEGLVVKQADSVLVTIWEGIVTGQLNATVGSNTPELDVFYLDPDSLEFQPETEEGFSLADSVDNASVATLNNTGDWSLNIHGVSVGTTNLFLRIHHIDHFDYLPPGIPVFVAGCCVGIRDNCDGIGGPNILDVNKLVGWLFAGASQPPCIAECDTDGGGTHNILDVNRLVSYLFAGGTSPASCP